MPQVGQLQIDPPPAPPKNNKHLNRNLGPFTADRKNLRSQFDPFIQFGGLGPVQANPQVSNFGLLGGTSQACQRDHMNVGQRWLLPYGFQHGRSVVLGEMKVQYDRARSRLAGKSALPLDKVKRLGAIPENLELILLSLLIQRMPEKKYVALIVFYNHDSRGTLSSSFQHDSVS